MIDDILSLQKQLTTVDEGHIRRALSTPNEAVPQFLLMMEMKRRQDLRQGPQGPVHTQDMRSEMASGRYQPAPQPPINLMAASDIMNSGIMSGMSPPGEVQGQQPQSLDVNSPAGLGSLFSGQR